MILIDTSAWIAFLRNSNDEVAIKVEKALSRKVATTDPVRMEVLAGARDEAHLQQLKGLLARATNIPTRSFDYEEAAHLMRRSRAAGGSRLATMDCLVAAVAIRSKAKILHANDAMNELVSLSPLKIA
ncbi:MAG: PIN domain-containing protein [Pseudomonadota bacterium]